MKKIVLSISAALVLLIGMANNIAVANATLSGQNTVAKTAIINFDHSWDNSL